MPNVKLASVKQNKIKKKLGVTHPGFKTDVGKFKLEQNWAEHWHTFDTALLANGHYKYGTTKAFALSITPNVLFQRFTMWLTGPYIKPEDQSDEEKQWTERFGNPQHWFDKRATGGWYTPDNVTKLATSLAQRYNALDAMRDVGNQVISKTVVRTSELAAQLDKEFHGRFFADDLDNAKNHERANFYLDLHRQIMDMQMKAMKMYALSYGINFDDAAALTSLLAGALQQHQSGTTLPAPQVAMMDNLASKLGRIAMSKAAAFGLPLPQNMADEIVDITAEPVKKKNVQ